MFKFSKYKFLRIFFFLFIFLVLIDTSMAGSYGAGPYGSGEYGIGYVAPTTVSEEGGGRTHETYTPIDLTKENTYELFKKDKIEFTLDNKVHTIKVDYIDKGYVDLEITSNLIKLRIYKGETKLVDINNDNINDIKITLNDIKYSKISISIELIIEDVNGKIKDAKIIKEAKEEKILEEEEVEEEDIVVEKPEALAGRTIFSGLLKNVVWIFILIILIVAVLLSTRLLTKYLRLEKILKKDIKTADQLSKTNISKADLIYNKIMDEYEKLPKIRKLKYYNSILALYKKLSKKQKKRVKRRKNKAKIKRKS